MVVFHSIYLCLIVLLFGSILAYPLPGPQLGLHLHRRDTTDSEQDHHLQNAEKNLGWVKVFDQRRDDTSRKILPDHLVNQARVDSLMAVAKHNSLANPHQETPEMDPRYQSSFKLQV